MNTHGHKTLWQSHQNVVLPIHLPLRLKEINWAERFVLFQTPGGFHQDRLFLFFSSTKRHSEGRQKKKSTHDNSGNLALLLSFLLVDFSWTGPLIRNYSQCWNFEGFGKLLQWLEQFQETNFATEDPFLVLFGFVC